jgi:hypothetical protein
VLVIRNPSIFHFRGGGEGVRGEPSNIERPDAAGDDGAEHSDDPDVAGHVVGEDDAGGI